LCCVYACCGVLCDAHALQVPFLCRVYGAQLTEERDAARRACEALEAELRESRRVYVDFSQTYSNDNAGLRQAVSDARHEHTDCDQLIVGLRSKYNQSAHHVSELIKTQIATDLKCESYEGALRAALEQLTIAVEAHESCGPTVSINLLCSFLCSLPSSTNPTNPPSRTNPTNPTNPTVLNRHVSSRPA
jgi:hypothetical protein